jgi:hypothetical protein
MNSSLLISASHPDHFHATMPQLPCQNSSHMSCLTPPRLCGHLHVCPNKIDIWLFDTARFYLNNSPKWFIIVFGSLLKINMLSTYISSMS